MVIGCRRWRIELEVSTAWVHVQPIVYLGKPEFKQAARLFDQLFMTLEFKRPWRWGRLFSDLSEARRFARELARMLGEPVYVDDLRTVLVAPEEVAEP